MKWFSDKFKEKKDWYSIAINVPNKIWFLLLQLNTQLKDIQQQFKQKENDLKDSSNKINQLQQKLDKVQKQLSSKVGIATHCKAEVCMKSNWSSLLYRVCL